MAARTAGLMPALKSWINSPTGPKTTHFWGPVANWGFVVAVGPVGNERYRYYPCGLVPLLLLLLTAL